MAYTLFKKLLRVFLVGVTLLLTGCRFAMFDPAGPIAEGQKELIIVATGLMLLVVIPVFILTIVFSWRYRATNTKATYKPDWAHSWVLESIWWAIPCVIIAILATITWITSHTLDPYRPIKSDVKPLNVQVVSLNWKWLFIYPEQNIATVNYLQIPENTPVSFKIASDAPMNSFWITQLGGQIMSMPAMQTQLHLLADKRGVYKGYSANFSGDGFSGMHFDVKVSSSEAFKNWVGEVKSAPQALTKSTYIALTEPSEFHKVTYYSLVEKNLFSSIIMQYMMPGQLMGSKSTPQSVTH